MIWRSVSAIACFTQRVIAAVVQVVSSAAWLESRARSVLVARALAGRVAAFMTTLVIMITAVVNVFSSNVEADQKRPSHVSTSLKLRLCGVTVRNGARFG